jgi:adenylate kinase
MIVAISGVGGTGKTSASKELIRLLKGYRLVLLNALASRTKAYIGYDEKRKSKIVDMRKLKSEVKELEKRQGKIVIEGLFAHEFDADMVIVLRCRPDVLKRRLRKKYKWHTKIAENAEAEMMGIITAEALAKHGRRNVFEIDTTKRSPKQTAQAIRATIEKRPKAHMAGKIDWMEGRSVRRFLS